MSYASTQFLSTDTSSAGNWKSTLLPISSAMASMGWVQSNDTGQVVWTATVLTLTQATLSGSNTIYNYSSFTGPSPRIGMSVAITGFANGANNVTKTITALSPGASGTFTVVNTGVNETHSGSATTTVTSVPAAGTFVPEIWQPGDSLTTFYVRIGYSISSGTPSGVRLTIGVGTSTNGASALSGTTTSTSLQEATSSNNAGSGANTFDCYFSGDISRMGMILWRGRALSPFPVIWMVERTKNLDGTDSNDGVTLATFASGSSSVSFAGEQTILFGVGASSYSTGQTNNFKTLYSDNISGSTAANNSIEFNPIFPIGLGRCYNPHTQIGFMHSQDIAEGALLSTVVYGNSHTYVATSVTVIEIDWSNTGYRLCMRFD